MKTENINVNIPSLKQVSAGGVAYREKDGKIEVVIIQTASEKRWQLPKGLVDEGETIEVAALREVREEAGVEAEIIAPIETIDYWFTADWDGTRKRIHKTVHFFLMRYTAGNLADHDDEVAEARWVTIEEALKMLVFKGEKTIVNKAAEMIGVC